MHIIFKTSDDTQLCLPFDEVSLKPGGHLSFSEEVCPLPFFIGRMSKKEFEEVRNNTKIASVFSVNGKRVPSNIIDMPLKELFALVSAAKQSDTPVVDVEHASGKKVYEKYVVRKNR